MSHPPLTEIAVSPYWTRYQTGEKVLCPGSRASRTCAGGRCRRILHQVLLGAACEYVRVAPAEPDHHTPQVHQQIRCRDCRSWIDVIVIDAARADALRRRA